MTSYLFHFVVPTRVRLVFSILQLCHLVYLTPSTLTVSTRFPRVLLIHRRDVPVLPQYVQHVAFLSFLPANAIVPYVHVLATERFFRSFPDLSLIQ